MSDELPPPLRPLPAFENRNVMEILTGAASGNADDHVRMCELNLMAGNAGTVEPEIALAQAELFAKMALVRGRLDAREHIINVLLAKAVRLRPLQPVRYVEALAEAVSYLDELASEDNEEATGNLDALLTDYVSSGGSEEDRASIVVRAKELRGWRDRYGTLA